MLQRDYLLAWRKQLAYNCNLVHVARTKMPAGVSLVLVHWIHRLLPQTPGPGTLDPQTPGPGALDPQTTSTACFYVLPVQGGG